MVVNRIEARNVEVKERNFLPAYYEGYLAEGAAAIVHEISLRDRSARATTAIDYGQDMYGRGSLDIVDGLRSRGERTTVKSAVDLLWRVRIIKSPFEAQLKRISLEIVNAAFDEVISEAHIGISEIDLFRRVQARTFAKGAERAYPMVVLFSRGDFVYSRLPQMLPLEEGHYAGRNFDRHMADIRPIATVSLA